MSKIKLQDIVEYSKSRISSNIVSLENFITTDNILQNKAGITIASNLPPSGDKMPMYNVNDILVSNIRPYLKKIWFSTKVGGCSSDVLVFKTRQGYSPKFIYYNLFSDDFFAHMMRGAKGTKMPRGDKSQILNYSIPDFDIDTQQKIANVLSSLDAKIDINNRINAELEAMAKTLYDYWFVQFDFPDANGLPYKTSGGKMVWNDDLKREIPEGWEVKKIDEIATLKAGGDKPMNYSLEETEENKIPIYSNGITNDGLYGYTDKPTINKQSITISARGTIGFCVLRNRPFVPIIRLVVLTPNLEGAAKYFFEALKHFNFENSGSVQQQLTVPQVKEVKLLYPNENILKKFDAITSPMQNQIENIKLENQTLTALRDWLLPMLMNGQVSVG